jgi:hypothetical protein
MNTSTDTKPKSRGTKSFAPRRSSLLDDSGDSFPKPTSRTGPETDSHSADAVKSTPTKHCMERKNARY